MLGQETRATSPLLRLLQILSQMSRRGGWCLLPVLFLSPQLKAWDATFSLQFKVAFLKSFTCLLQQTHLYSTRGFAVQSGPSFVLQRGQLFPRVPLPLHHVWWLLWALGHWHLLKLLTFCLRSCLTPGPDIVRPMPSTECALAPEQALHMYFGVLLHIWVKDLSGCKWCRALGQCSLSVRGVRVVGTGWQPSPFCHVPSMICLLLTLCLLECSET